MTTVQAILLAILQGITELFPISSLGHAVIVPALLGWNVDEHASGFLPFLVVMHLGTAAALLIYFARDWCGFAVAVLARRHPAGASERRLFWQVVVATIPAMLLGFLFERQLREGFAAPRLAAVFLIVNGLMLWLADGWRNAERRALVDLRWRDAAIIGVWQCLALIPGLSRSGATMAGGYRAGLSHEDAARFSFLTATPIILGAGVLEVPKMFKQGSVLGKMSLLAGLVAGVAAFIAVAVLMRWFRDHEARGFRPFAIYCVGAGVAALTALAL